VQTTDPNLITIPVTDLDDGDHDPFRVFDEGQGAGQPNPYPDWEDKRRHTPVEKFDLHAQIGLPYDADLPESLRHSPATFTVFGYDEAVEVLQDNKRFSSDNYADIVGTLFGRSMLQMNDPEHRHNRALVAQAFRPKVLKRWQDELIQPILDQMVDEFADKGEADLVEAFTFSFPVKVISGLLGVPLEHWEWYLRRTVEVISLVQDWNRAQKAADALKDYFTQIIELRRREPTGDLISELVQAEIDGQKLTDAEILPFLMLLSPAGAETTFRSTGNLLVGLFSNPDQYAAVLADRDLLPAAIEEAIRWEPPLVFIYRKATVDTAIGGVDIPAGSNIAVCLGSANRSKKTFGDDAEVFNIHRAPAHHVAFATGAHMCLGMHLARMEMRAACNTLFDRLPNLRLDPEQADDVFIDGIVFRSPNRLPAIWDVT